LNPFASAARTILVTDEGDASVDRVTHNARTSAAEDAGGTGRRAADGVVRDSAIAQASAQEKMKTRRMIRSRVAEERL
jgi:hypothetical protein